MGDQLDHLRIVWKMTKTQLGTREYCYVVDNRIIHGQPVLPAARGQKCSTRRC